MMSPEEQTSLIRVAVMLDDLKTQNERASKETRESFEKLDKKVEDFKTQFVESRVADQQRDDAIKQLQDQVDEQNKRWQVLSQRIWAMWMFSAGGALELFWHLWALINSTKH